MIRMYNLMLVSMLPFIYGCLSGGGGSGSGSSAGFIGGGENFAGGGSGIGSGIGVGGGSGSGLETIANPEPATMLLVGGGVAAMAYYRKFKK